jgi:hypothetical protein
MSFEHGSHGTAFKVACNSTHAHTTHLDYGLSCSAECCRCCRRCLCSAPRCRRRVRVCQQVVMACRRCQHLLLPHTHVAHRGQKAQPHAHAQPALLLLIEACDARHIKQRQVSDCDGKIRSQHPKDFSITHLSGVNTAAVAHATLRLLYWPNQLHQTVTGISYNSTFGSAASAASSRFCCASSDSSLSMLPLNLSLGGSAAVCIHAVMRPKGTANKADRKCISTAPHM